ncbi:MAG TPA: purine-nucleoside phosphorylase [Sphaerochaeta sp.]|nr:purine-nucleoside phosphorylase [Sphaerochaeta sp.]
MSVHIAAKKVASVVLAPGDPLRAKLVAERFLEKSRLITDIRNILGYTGIYKGVEISVIATGMGGPSIGIYSYELFNEYDVETIIRIGTCGGFKKEILPGDRILALTASTDSAWAHQYNLKGTLSPACDPDLLLTAALLDPSAHVGMVFSSDLFSSYNALGEESWKAWAAMGALAQDMETYALYATAAHANKRALSMLTMTDCLATGNALHDDERQSALYPMIELALEVAYREL